VTETPGGAVANATIRITDGPNTGAATKTDAVGLYRFNGLTSGTTMNVSASVAYGDSVKELTLSSGINRLDFNFESPVFFASGVGNGTINVPSYVTRARISGTYTGNCAGFFVGFQNTRIDVVSEILGTGVAGTNGCEYFAGADFISSGTLYEAVHNLPVFSNRPPLIVTAPEVSWSFEEVR
jgi:hypothetical protein